MMTFVDCQIRLPDGMLVPVPDGTMTREAFSDLVTAEMIAWQTRAAERGR